MKVRFQNDRLGEKWFIAVVNAANDVFDDLMRRGLSPGQVGMVATLVLQRLIQANEVAPEGPRLGYPLDWPVCPGCGLPVMDGHITCGQAQCDEGGRR